MKSEQAVYDELMERVFQRRHVAVVGIKEQVDDMASKYGWNYIIKPLCEQDALVIVAVDINKREIFCVLGTIWQLQNIRETVINYSRYGKLLPYDSIRLENLFIPEYESLSPEYNARVQAENVSHYCNMIDYGFEFGKEILEDMLIFCEHNELYSQASKIKEQLEKAT